LIAVGGHGRAVGAFHSDVEDAEPDLRRPLGPAPAGSQTVTFGELFDSRRLLFSRSGSATASGA
jgi:hypothetical protein